MNEIVSHLASEGYNVDGVVPDGKIHRFMVDEKDHKKSAFYIAHRNFSEKTGEEFYVVCYGSWRGEKTKTYCSLKGKMSAADKKNVKKRIDELKKRESAIRLKEQEKVSDEVKEIWDKLNDVGPSDYLKKKGILSDSLGIKYSLNGEIYVPACDSQGRVWSFQRIGWDGRKMFHPGGRIRGCFHTIGDVSGAGKIFICEGFATAASIFLATKGYVVCAFNAHNVGEVATEIKKLHPNRPIVICGDNDQWASRPNGEPYNAGKDAGEKAAKATFGKLVLPQFKNLDTKPTDFNDLHVLEGVEKVKEQLAGVKIERNYLMALGFKEKEYFFTSSNNQQIVTITAFRKSDFLNLMPLEYWEITFPGAGATKVDWDEATSQLMSQARRRGIFQSQHIRGAGVWDDEGRVVVNMGDHLIVDGRKVDLGDIKSKFFYTLGIKMPELNPKPLTAKECEIVTDACAKFKWKKPDYGYLLAGAMVTTRVCGALPIRPHVWLTGEKGSGKTTLFNRLIYPLIGQPLIFAGGKSTEAGIRQEVCANAVPVLFDEFENNGPKSADQIHDILDLMRLSWSETKAAVIKGGSSGVATSYRARFAAIVTSIRQVSMNDADKSRFATLELGDHGSDEQHWLVLDAALSKISEEFGSRLFARSIQLLPVLLTNYDTMKAALGRKAPGQRFADQYGMLLAGYGLLMQDGPMTTGQADFIASQVDLEEEREEAGVSDHASALNQLCTTSVVVEYAASHKECLIGKLIEMITEKPNEYQPEKNSLSNIGIRVESKFVAIIATEHAMLEKKVYYKTRWSKNWGSSLKRLPGAEKARVRIDGSPRWCIKIPTKFFKT